MKNMLQTERLFLGLNLDPLFHTDISVCAERLRQLYPEQKWVRFRHFHFTVHFLGDTTAKQKEKIQSIAKSIAQATQPFDVSLEGMGAFPNLNKPRVIWIGAAQECRLDLEEFYRKVTCPLIAEGFPVEHETFTPHTTLFRVRADNPIVWNEDVFSFSKTPFRTVKQLTLFKSVLSDQASEYVPIQDFLFSNVKGQE